MKIRKTKSPWSTDCPPPCYNCENQGRSGDVYWDNIAKEWECRECGNSFPGAPPSDLEEETK